MKLDKKLSLNLLFLILIGFTKITHFTSPDIKYNHDINHNFPSRCDKKLIKSLVWEKVRVCSKLKWIRQQHVSKCLVLSVVGRIS